MALHPAQVYIPPYVHMPMQTPCLRNSAKRSVNNTPTPPMINKPSQTSSQHEASPTPRIIQP
ncbi:hypothetical protein B0H67DRAFT_573426, partial [Lasiosphaeris hirsuta]